MVFLLYGWDITSTLQNPDTSSEGTNLPLHHYISFNELYLEG